VSTHESGPGAQPPECGIDVALLDGSHVVRVAGELDIFTSASLRQRLEALIVDGTPRLIIDLRAVTFLDSSGLGALVMAHRKLRVLRGGFAVVVEDGAVERVLVATGLKHVLRVFGTVEEAHAELCASARPDGD
jgi:anti-anti-sigma factor